MSPPKFNSSPLENGWLEDKPFLLGWPIFRGYVELPGSNGWVHLKIRVGWKGDSYWKASFFGGVYVSFRGCITMGYYSYTATKVSVQVIIEVGGNKC